MKKRDLFLIGGILLLALALLLVIQLTKKTGAYVIVRIDGADVAHYSLSEPQTYPLNGGTNTLRIEDGKAWLIDADCPDQICVRQGMIDEVGETVTCLPNRLTVTVYGADAGVDFVT